MVHRERPAFPTERDVLDARFAQAEIDHSKSFAGVIQGLSADRQTCDIVPLIQQPVLRPDGGFDLENLPVIPSCAILRQRTRGAFLSLPIENGDTVLCIALDDDHSAWRRGSSNDPAPPRDLRRHHPAHAVVVGTFYRFDQPLREASVRAADVGADAGIVLGFDAAGGTRLLMKPDGSVEITQGAGMVVQIDASGVVHLGGAAAVTKALGIAELIDARLSALRTAMNMHTHPASSGTTSATVDGQVAALASVAATKVLGV